MSFKDLSKNLKKAKNKPVTPSEDSTGSAQKDTDKTKP